MLGCDGVSGAWTPLHPARIGREKKLVEASQVLAIHACPLWVNLVESVEDPPVGRVAKDEAEVTSRCARCEDSLYRCTRIRKRFVGTLLGSLHNPIQFVLSNQDAADVVGNYVPIDAAPEPQQQFLSRCHGPPGGVMLVGDVPFTALKVGIFKADAGYV
jgi:hypothetical protein